MEFIQESLFGKMYPERSPVTTDKILGQCSKKSFTPKFQCLSLEDGQPQEWSEGTGVVLRGEWSMRNIGESPSVGVESTLSQILEDNVPQKYYLSVKACLGILRRAEKRGKKLPPLLEMALRQQSQCELEKDAPGGKGQLLSPERSLTLSCNNDQYLFVPQIVGSLQASGAKQYFCNNQAVDQGHLICEPQLFDMTHADEVMRPVKDGISPTLNARIGTGGNQVPVLMEPIPINDKATRYMSGGKTRNQDGSGNGFGVGKPGDPMPTLTVGDRHAVFTTASFLNYAVRRLTPTECEKLQGLPDGWTSGGSDSARYKAIGNGLAVVNPRWILQQVRKVLDRG